MNLTAQVFTKKSRTENKEEPISTNLYELVEAINNEISSGEEELISTVLIDLNNKGLVRMGPRMRSYLLQYN